MVNYEMKKKVSGSKGVDKVVVTMVADRFNRENTDFNATLEFTKAEFDDRGVLIVQHLISNGCGLSDYKNKYGIRLPRSIEGGGFLEEVEVVYYDSEGVAWDVEVPYGQFEDMFEAMDNELVSVEEAAEWFLANDTQEDYDIFWEQWVPGLYGVTGEEADELKKKYGRK